MIKKNSIKLTVVFLAVVFLMPKISQAATINANSCNQGDVQATINSAGNGDTVMIPAGNCTWTSQVSVDLSSGKELTISGSGIDVTNITDKGFGVTGVIGKKWRITNMTMKGSSGTYAGIIEVFGTSDRFRIDHIKFDSITSRVITVFATSYGVIDHCTFYHLSGVIAIHMREMESGGNKSWNRGVDFGTAQAVYIEDNVFTNEVSGFAAITDADVGGRFVLRHNQATNFTVATHDCTTGDVRSVLSYEIYGNTFTTEASYGNPLIGVRGGTGRIYNNTFIATQSNPFYSPTSIEVMSYRVCDMTHQSPWNTWCDGTVHKACLGINDYAYACTSDADCNNEAGACQVIDGPAGGTTPGYPCRDQFGMGRNTAAANGGHVPAVLWNNKISIAGGAFTPAYVSVRNYGNGIGDGQRPDCSDSNFTAKYVLKNRDYCESDTTMPISCNGIATNYTAYTYPHPLTLADSACILKGDSNSDGNINISDVQICINVLLGNDTNSIHQTCSDMNGGGVNISDCQAIINKILNP